MVSYFVRHRGKAADPATFVGYYHNRHTAILRSFRQIKSLVLHRPAAFSNPFPVQRHGSPFSRRWCSRTKPGS